MSKQLEFKKVNGWGGKRRGAGRPNRSQQVSPAKRDRVDFRKPLHVTMKLKVSSLRTHSLMKTLKRSAGLARRFNMHVIHFSIQHSHIHLIVEAKDNASLAAGMKSLTIRFAKTVRGLIGGSGSVFTGRFHLHVLRTPTEMRRALEYVLLNFAKHERMIAHLDTFSSGAHFLNWKELLGKRLPDFLREQSKDFRACEELSLPRSWIASKGWMLART